MLPEAQVDVPNVAGEPVDRPGVGEGERLLAGDALCSGSPTNVGLRSRSGVAPLRGSRGGRGPSGRLTVKFIHGPMPGLMGITSPGSASNILR